MARGCGFRAPSQDMCVVASVKLIPQRGGLFLVFLHDDGGVVAAEAE